MEEYSTAIGSDEAQMVHALVTCEYNAIQYIKSVATPTARTSRRVHIAIVVPYNTNFTIGKSSYTLWTFIRFSERTFYIGLQATIPPPQQFSAAVNCCTRQEVLSP